MRATWASVECWVYDRKNDDRREEAYLRMRNRRHTLETGHTMTWVELQPQTTSSPMQVPSRMAGPFLKVCEGPKVAEADTDAGGQRMLGQANCGGVLVESTIRPPLYICSSGLVLD